MEQEKYLNMPLNALLETVRALNENGKYREAIDILNETILNKHRSAELYAEKAQSYFRLGEKELSKREVNKALLWDKSNAKANHYNAHFYLANRDLKEAIEYFKNAILYDPTYPSSHYGLGEAYRQKRLYEEAKNEFNEAITLRPNFSHAYNGLGDVYRDTKEFEKAEEQYKKAIDYDPNFAFPYNGLGDVYRNLKKYKKALEYYNTAIAKGEQLPAPYYNRAMVYEAMEEYDKAIDDYKQFLSVSTKSNYHTDKAKEKIIELKGKIFNTLPNRIDKSVKAIKNLLLFKGDCVTHYTSLSAASALIFEKSHFRLSEGAFLNDTSEGREFFNYLSFYLSSKINNDTLAQPFSQKPFIGSFVEEGKHDDLTLWRMYGKENKEEAKGCAITLTREELLKEIRNQLITETGAITSKETLEDFNFYRVAYRRQGKKDYFVIPGCGQDSEAELNILLRELKDYLKEIDIEKKIDDENYIEIVKSLNEITYLFKSADYEYEYELRLVVNGNYFKKNIQVEYSPVRVYVDLIQISSLLKKITIGPKVEKADEWAAAFYYCLNKEKYKPDILLSRLPFR